MRRYQVTEDQAGQRADVFIASQYKDLTRSSIEKLFEESLVSKGGKPVKAGQKVKHGDELLLDDTMLLASPGPIKLPVIYEDSDVIVINKPEGVLSHSKGPLNHEATVATFIKPMLRGIADNNRAGIVHRLDRGTSGVIITAKNTAAATKLQRQFSQRRVKKTYLAIVEGIPEQKQALIDIAIERNPRRPQTFRADAAGKPAQTEYRVLKEFENEDKSYALLELYPKTGRTHQLRVHLAYIGNPVVGDRLYGKNQADHLYLHAAALELTLPDSSRQVFKAPQPDYFKDFKEKK